MFMNYPDIPPGALAPEKQEWVNTVAQGLQRAEIVKIRRQFVTLRLRNADDVIEGDVSPTGYTVYLGGFDWVTFPTPQHVLQRFPELLPLPQQMLDNDDQGYQGGIPDLEL